MNYADGVNKMKQLAGELKQNGGGTASFTFGSLLISYPGFKGLGDYKLTENGVAPKHTQVVKEIYQQTNSRNIDAVIGYLEEVYHKGLGAASSIFSTAFTEKLFWITLQEEINYPQPLMAGRKLAFQRFYEAALAKLGIISLEEVLNRTNNHGKKRPSLLDVMQYRRPSFYT